MATKIPWTDEVWNLTSGCTPVSPGCQNCNAERMHNRLRAMGQAKYQHPFTEVRIHPEELDKPLHWKKPRRIFVESMADLFHEDVPAAFIDEAFAVMALCPQHTFQVLTKRPVRAHTYLLDEDLHHAHGTLCAGRSECIAKAMWDRDEHAPNVDWPLPNVQLGVTAENQEWFDKRVPVLLNTPAAVRFVSCEPLLGPIDLSLELRCIASDGCCTHCGMLRWEEDQGLEHECPPGFGPTLDWVIIGCESGPGRRPCRIEWVRDIVRQCDEAQVPCFVKQIEVPRVAKEELMALGADDRTGQLWRGRMEIEGSRVSRNPDEWPADIRVQQFPEAPAP